MEERRYSSWMLERIVIGDTVRLQLGTSTMGRHSTSTVRVIDSTYMSRHHAVFEVSDNDQMVTIEDVSSNGIYINQIKYDKTKVQLKKNDLIGMGVSPANLSDYTDMIKLPIYQLKYSPMREFQIPYMNNISPAPSCTAGFEINNKNNVTKDNDVDLEDQQPNCSKISKVEKITVRDEIFEISDDDEECFVKENTKSYQENVTVQQKSTEIQQELAEEVNKSIDAIIKNEAFDEKDNITPSQKRLEVKLDKVILNDDKINSPQVPANQEALNKNNDKEEIVNKPNASTSSCNFKEEKEPAMHMPIIPDIKKEIIRSVSADIQNIFGDIRDDAELQKTIKEINPLVYNAINASNNLNGSNLESKTLNNGELIDLTDLENLEDAEVEDLGTIVPNVVQNKNENDRTAQTPNIEQEESKGKDSSAVERCKSPNIFDSSLDDSRDELKSLGDNVDLNAYTKYMPNADDEDIEELMFSQAIINDMKDELQDKLNDQENLPLPNTNFVNELQPSVSNNTINIKQEPGLELFSSIPKELENSCWIISDEEDYDEELETKVNDWSNKIFSQSFNLFSQNMSQVYEMEEPNKNDDNEDDDNFDDNNLNLLEDDIDGIADIYNNIDGSDSANKNNALDGEMQNELQEAVGELSTKPAKAENVEEDIKTEDNDMQQEKPKSMEIENIPNEEIDNRETSPIENDSKIDFQSPLLRSRRLSKSRPVIESSSSEDELDDKTNKVPDNIEVTEVDKLTTRLPPPVIEAPALPKSRGKLRGVSAELSKTESTNKTLASLKDKIKHDNYTKDLKRKWIEKPSIARKREREHNKVIKECRKDKLKKLAESKKPSSQKMGIKRRMSADGNESKVKLAKVKVTAHNRGAFLANNGLAPPAAPQAHKADQTKQFKIPKVVKVTDEQKKSECLSVSKRYSATRSYSVDDLETFSQQISKPDLLLLKRQSGEAKKSSNSNQTNKTPDTAPLRRNSATDMFKLPAPSSAIPLTSAVCKEAIAARAVRTTNKITFASMEKNIIESEESKRRLSALSSMSATKAYPLVSINKATSTTKPTGQKKTVRFNETPVIHYIERVMGACKRVYNKDVMMVPLSTYKNRRLSIRTAYPIIDQTSSIISKILCWSNEWLIKRNAAVDAAADVVYPMTSTFNSFDHYKSIVFPLMKLEFISTLERDYSSTQNAKILTVSLEYAYLNQDRIVLVTKSAITNPNRESVECSLYDLVLLDMCKRGSQIFAFVVHIRKGSGYFTIIYEILASNFTLEYFKEIQELKVRPVMDKVRVHFGAFNAVYQLQLTPLFQKIMNPLELLKCRPPPKKKVSYRGFDQLNDKQKQVLLNTYVKVIDESTPNITLINGPPGTGKSCVITNLVLQSLYGEEVRYLDKKILICAQSNAAVDVIAGKLYDISLRMRPEKRFRIIRHGILNKIHPNVHPIALQKLVEDDQLKKLQARNQNINLENKENLKSQILQFEAQVAEMSMRNIKGTVEEDILIEKKRQLQLMRNILNDYMRPEDERSLFSWYLCNANIVCATLSSCVNLTQYINFFDICIIDEATQCTEPFTLLPLKFGINSLVLVGDTQQLPATVLSKKANELGLGNSMFTRIRSCLESISSTHLTENKGAATTPSNIIYNLETQYRMHPEICRWPNQYFYRNELSSDKSTIDFNKSPLLPFSVLNLTYTQNTSGVNGRIKNNLEADFVAKLLKALDGFIPNIYNSYGVITPYAHHRTTLESSIRNLGLKNIMVNTIDSYQGLQKDVIVISNARTNGIGFLCNPQRLNVALTRAKKCLILCGNFKNLESVPSWRCLLENARERKLYFEIAANCMEDIQTHVMDKIKLKNNQNH